MVVGKVVLVEIFVVGVMLTENEVIEVDRTILVSMTIITMVE